MTQAQLAKKIKTTSPYVNRIIKTQDGVVNKTFVQVLEALEYDIEITYVRWEDQADTKKFWSAFEISGHRKRLRLSIENTGQKL